MSKPPSRPAPVLRTVDADDETIQRFAYSLASHLDQISGYSLAEGSPNVSDLLHPLFCLNPFVNGLLCNAGCISGGSNGTGSGVVRQRSELGLFVVSSASSLSGLTLHCLSSLNFGDNNTGCMKIQGCMQLQAKRISPALKKQGFVSLYPLSTVPRASLALVC